VNAPAHTPQDLIASLLAERYGQPGNPPSATNPTLGTLFSHRSVRAYRSTPLPDGTIDTLVAAAQSASTSSNLQAWSVIAVQDAQRKERLATLANNQAHIRQAPLFLVWLADLARLEKLGQKVGHRPAAIDYMELLLVGVIDAALAAQNAAVAAESLGLGIVYIGAMRNQPEKIAAELNLPPHSVAVFGMCVGYPDPARPATIKPRLAQGAVLHHETYDNEAITQTLSDYNRIMADFYQGQSMAPEGDWAQQSVNRVRGPESLSGRHRLVEALNNRGFELR